MSTWPNQNYSPHSWTPGEVITKNRVEEIQNAIQFIEQNKVNFLDNILEYGTYISDATDLNDYTDTGWYFFSDTSVAGKEKNNSIRNKPSDQTVDPFTLLVFNTTRKNSITQRVIQIFITIQTGKVYVRTKGNNSSGGVLINYGWYDWHKLITYDELAHYIDLQEEEDISVSNLTPFIYYYEYLYGKDFEKDGVRWKINANHSITVTQTMNTPRIDDAYFYLTSASLTEFVPPIPIDKRKTYFVSGCPENGSNNRFNLQVWSSNSVDNPLELNLLQENDVNWTRRAREYGDGTSVESSGGDYFLLRIYISKNYTIPEQGLTFYPSLSLGETRIAYKFTKPKDNELYWYLLDSLNNNNKNLIPSKYFSELKYGINYTNNGITWTLNDNGSITATGSANETSSLNGEGKDSYYYITGWNMRQNPTPLLLKTNIDYFLKGCPAQEDNSFSYSLQGCILKDNFNYNINFNTNFNDESIWNIINENGSGLSLGRSEEERILGIRIKINYGTILPENGITFYPMLTEKQDVGKNYIETHKSVNDNIDLIQASELVETAKTYIGRKRQDYSAGIQEEVLPNGLIYKQSTSNFPRMNYTKVNGYIDDSSFVTSVLMGLKYEDTPNGILKNVQYSYVDSLSQTINVKGADYKVMDIRNSEEKQQWLRDGLDSELSIAQRTNLLNQQTALNNAINNSIVYVWHPGNQQWAFNCAKYDIYHASSLCKFLTYAGTRLSFEPESYDTYVRKPNLGESNYELKLRYWRTENVAIARKLREAGARKGDIIFTANEDVGDRKYLGITHVSILAYDPPTEDQLANNPNFNDDIYKIIINARETTMDSFGINSYESAGVRYDYLARICHTIKAICRPLTGETAYGRYMSAAKLYTDNRLPNSVGHNLFSFPYSDTSTPHGIETVELEDLDNENSETKLQIRVNENGTINVLNSLPANSHYRFYICRRAERSVVIEGNKHYSLSILPYGMTNASENSVQAFFSIWRSSNFSADSLDNANFYGFDRGRGNEEIFISSSSSFYLDCYIDFINKTSSAINYTNITFYPMLQEGSFIFSYQNPRLSEINIAKKISLIDIEDTIENINDPNDPTEKQNEEDPDLILSGDINEDGGEESAETDIEFNI